MVPLNKGELAFGESKVWPAGEIAQFRHGYRQLSVQPAGVHVLQPDQRTSTTAFKFLVTLVPISTIDELAKTGAAWPRLRVSSGVAVYDEKKVI